MRARAEVSVSGQPERVCPNGDVIFAKVIDGEAMIMNVRSGVYYSMDQVGALVWAKIEEAATREDIVAAVTASYVVSPEQAASDVERLLRELLDEQIVRAADGDNIHVPPARSSPVDSQGERATREVYAAPTLTTYRDMGDLLALDPPAPALKDLRWKG